MSLTDVMIHLRFQVMCDRELAKKIQKDWRPLPAAKQNLSMETKKAPNPHELGILKPFQKQDHVVTVRSSALESSSYLTPSCAKADGALVGAKNKENPAVSARKYASTSIADLEVPKNCSDYFSNLTWNTSVHASASANPFF